MSSVNDVIFQSTRPLRGATAGVDGHATQLAKFQSTRPLRGATPERHGWRKPCGISIHAPPAGRDALAWLLDKLLNISIHAPLAGRDGHKHGKSAIQQPAFQSTRPLRGAT